MTDEDTLDPQLLERVLCSVRLTAVLPCRVRITKWIKGKETDSHVFEFPVGAQLPAIQKEVTAVTARWQGGFELGVEFRLERIG